MHHFGWMKLGQTCFPLDKFMHHVKLLPQQGWGPERAVMVAKSSPGWLSPSGVPGPLRIDVRTVQLQVVAGISDSWKTGFGSRLSLGVSWGFREDGPAQETSSAPKLHSRQHGLCGHVAPGHSGVKEGHSSSSASDSCCRCSTFPRRRGLKPGKFVARGSGGQKPPVSFTRLRSRCPRGWFLLEAPAHPRPLVPVPSSNPSPRLPLRVLIPPPPCRTQR